MMSQKYPIEWVNHWVGNFDDWFYNFKEQVIHRDIFLEQIEKNKQDPKLKKLHISEIIL